MGGQALARLVLSVNTMKFPAVQYIDLDQIRCADEAETIQPCHGMYRRSALAHMKRLTPYTPPTDQVSHAL